MAGSAGRSRCRKGPPGQYRCGQTGKRGGPGEHISRDTESFARDLPDQGTGHGGRHHDDHGDAEPSHIWRAPQPKAVHRVPLGIISHSPYSIRNQAWRATERRINVSRTVRPDAACFLGWEQVDALDFGRCARHGVARCARIRQRLAMAFSCIRISICRGWAGATTNWVCRSNIELRGLSWGYAAW